MIDATSEIGSAFRQGLFGKKRPDYKDPWDYFGAEWDDPKDKGAALWQRAAWLGKPYLNKGTGVTVPGEITVRTPGHELAAVGAKGSAKTFFGGMRAGRLIQKYPGGKGMIVANSYAQAYGSAAVKLVEISGAMGIEWFHRTEMMIDGIKHYNVYVFPDYDHVVCVLSFDNITLIEGTEWDWAWFEEIQDCAQTDVETAVSRLRRGVGDGSVYYAGMPDDENHWMYAYFERNGIPIYEPDLYENEHNLPENYLPRMRRMYSGADFERYVQGKRVSLFKSKCLPNFQWDLHVRSELARRLTSYDPHRKLYITFDFNVSPMCASLWQMKEWRFDQEEVPVDWACPSCGGRGYAGGECNSCDESPAYIAVRFQKRSAPKAVLCQVDEYEMWGATTKAMCEKILEDY